MSKSTPLPMSIVDIITPKGGTKKVEEAPPTEVKQVTPTPAPVSGKTYQCSVQVDEETFDRFSLARAKSRKKGQVILSEALAMWLEKNKF